jgi:hypothetical protein
MIARMKRLSIAGNKGKSVGLQRYNSPTKTARPSKKDAAIIENKACLCESSS